jgi:dihydrolipoamide dehydrogenase
MIKETYNLLIIGAGPGGYVAGIRAAQLGMKVCVVEKANVGGVCLNLGCIPTKSALREAEIIKNAVNRFGESLKVNSDELWKGIVSAAQKPISDLRNGIENLFKLHNIELIRGEAYFDSNKIIVKTNEATCSPRADNIIIATGSSPSTLPGIDTDHERIITSNDVFLLKRPPQRLAIIGAGAVGVEFSTLFSGLSEEIYLVEMMPHVLPFLDEDISIALERELKKQRIKLLTGVKVMGCEKEETIKLHLGNEKVINVDCVLLAGGRRANTEFLAGTGIEIEKNGKIKVDLSMRTNLNGYYAIGDCAGPLMLAHTASEEGIVAVETIAGHAKSMDYSAIPLTVFSSPEVASVGITESKAKEMGIPVKTSSILLRTLGRPHADRSVAGIIKLIINETGTIIGGEIVGKSATEIVHIIALSIKQKLNYRELQEFVCAHPTYSELIREVAESINGKAIHTMSK